MFIAHKWSIFAFAASPTGSLPMLIIDGNEQLVQSMAIARYVAQEFGIILL